MSLNSLSVPSQYILPPHESGARIRILAKGIQELLQAGPSHGEPYFPTDPAVDSGWLEVSLSLKALHTAIPRRRVAELRDAHDLLNTRIVEWRKRVYADARSLAVRERNRVLKEARLNSGETLVRAAEEIWFLCQNLPTQPGLPSADSRDVALRGIIAILRTHEIPGSEKLTHEAKEDAGATQEAKLDDEAASAVAAAVQAPSPSPF